MSIPPPSAPSSSSQTLTYQFTYTAAAVTNSSYFPLPFHLQQPNPTTVPQYPRPYVAPAAAVVPSVYPGPVYFLPQYHQAQQLFQRDAQEITPEALESVKAALASSEIEHKAETKRKAVPRKAAGQAWEDPTLADWPENDYRLFCGDLGNEGNDGVLSKVFSRFPSFNMARVNVGNRPIKLRQSKWQERTDFEALGRPKNQNQKKPKLPKKSILHKQFRGYFLEAASLLSR